MNYLSHIYLSGDSEALQLGNFIGDFVKGRQYENYPIEVANGIVLHRLIDSYTDRHPVVRECTMKLRPGYGKYAGIVMDIFWDHFLAVNWLNYSIEHLAPFTKRFHALLLSNFFQLPRQVQLVVPFLIQNKRLQSYGTLAGIEKTLTIMSQHASLPAQTNFAMHTLTDEYDYFNDAFNQFFPQIIGFVEISSGFIIEQPE